MKKLITITLLALTTATVQAQTFDEWFRQQKTQKEYLVQQIAALQAYSGTLWQGYTLLRQGISTVHRSKNDDLGLHQDFFSSLQHVNPAIGQSAKVLDIIARQAAIQQDFGKTLLSLHQTGLLTSDELAYLKQVYENVLERCARDVEALWRIFTPGELELRDEERFRQVAQIHQSTLATYRFTRSFFEETQLILIQRAAERRELEKSKQLY